MTDDSEENREMREHLNQIRATGKGSRGGAGSRKRRNGGKPLTRRHSKREVENESLAVKAIMSRYSKVASREELKQTAKLLQENLNREDVDDLPPTSFWEAVKKSHQRLIYHNLKRQYLDLFMYLLAIHEWIVGSGLAMSLHLRQLGEQSGTMVSTGFDLPKAILEAAVDYSGKGEDHRRAKSRHLQAFRHLIKDGVKSYGLEAYQEAHGGGVDDWHRATPKTAGRDAKRVKAEAIALKIEQDESNPEAEDDYYNEDEKTTGNDKWLAPVGNRQERVDAGEELSSGGIWEGHMIRYCVREMGLRTGEGMVVLVAGDECIPVGGRLIKAANLGQIIADPKSRSEGVAMVITVAQRLLGRPPRGLTFATAPVPPDDDQGAWPKDP